MEFFLFSLFFISALIFFIAGKDDFGRKENKLITKESGKVKKEVSIEPTVEVKEEEELITNESKKVKKEVSIEPTVEIKEEEEELKQNE